MIVLEGSDCVGKTTLARRLFELIPERTKYHSVMHRHFTKTPRRFHRYHGYAECVQRNVVFDRFHLSHLAYRACVEDDPQTMTPLMYEAVDARISLVGGIVVVLCPPNDVIKERFGSTNKEEMYDLELALKVNDFFVTNLRHGRMTHVNDLGLYKPKIDIIFNQAYDVDYMSNEIIDVWSKRQYELEEINNRVDEFVEL